MKWNSFSPNMLKTYEACPRKFYLKYVESLNVPYSDTLFEKGKKIHALANYYFQGVNISRLESALDEEELITWKLLLNNEYYRKECLKSEFSLVSKLGDYWIGGRVDALVRDEDNYYILDYKTGAIPKNPHYDYQTMIYLLCVDKYLKNYNSLSFVYVNLKEKKNYVFNFDEKIKNLYEDKVSATCKQLEQDSIYLPNTKNCKFCEYSKYCNISEFL